MLSFSTCWNSSRHQDGAAMIEEILALGFDTVELGHGTRVSLLAGIQRLFDSGRFRVSSLHNFCPLPVEVTTANPDCYEFTSHRSLDRERAVKLTRQTIDCAVRLGATYVVLHLGRVHTMRPCTRELIALAKEGRLLSKAAIQLKIAAVREREASGPSYLQRALECLKPIVEYAAERNIFLGVEGRHSYEELPSEREFAQVFAALDSSQVGYWHDFGHLQVKQDIGLVDHAEALWQKRDRFFGGHLHDTIWPGEDHQVPFSGGVDFARLIPMLPPNAPFVWEMSPRQTAEQIELALGQWRERFPGTLSGNALSSAPSVAVHPPR
jgi:sugar phosphate isomerase/epimerase